MTSYTVPSLEPAQGRQLAELLQERLTALLDLQLTLKHVHWNLVGPGFIGVHEMLDPQVDAVRLMSDTVAERIATLGGVPQGTPGSILAHRSWDDYDLGRDLVPAHLAALDLVYTGVIADHRAAVAATGDLDHVTEDLLVAQLHALEKFQWFVRAHLEDGSGTLAHQGESTEKGAAAAAS